MGYPGIELTWKPGTDDNWVSYYQILRGGQPIDRVAKGSYYFDHSAGADMAAKYEIRTVDGAGNASKTAEADGPVAKPSTIFDDSANATVKYTGQWRQQTDLPPAHSGTLTSSSEPNATVTLEWEGKRIQWFAKLGANAGKAAVSVDDAPAEIVDTYSADDIWGVCVYCKECEKSGRHTLKITVLGQHGPSATDSVISIDGLRTER
jgi:hypothetical protein